MNYRRVNVFSIVKKIIVSVNLILLLTFSVNFVFAQQIRLTADDVRTVISQAVSAAVAMDRRVTVAVTDHEGNVLGIFLMNGTNGNTRISGGGSGNILEGFVAPATFAAVSKAGTGSLFGTTGNAFTTRSASFIIQEHFPPGIDFRPGGPLYGVQFSSLPCSDIVVSGLPLGLSGDPGGLPLYKNGVPVGGVGIEGDGIYTVDRNVFDFDQPFEEVVAAAAQRGFSPPPLIRADNILIEGIRLPFANVNVDEPPVTGTQIPFANLPGIVDPTNPIRTAPNSRFSPVTLNGVPGEAEERFFPGRAGSLLSAAEVQQILGAGAQTANITRAGIRQPLGSSARVSIAVVDVDGRVLGIFRTLDAPVFGYDVSVQKARSVAFISRADAGAQLRTAGFSRYVERASADGIGLDGAIAFSNRGFGFLHRPFFPDGINGTPAGPFSTEIGQWSPFNVGLQSDLVQVRLTTPSPPVCQAIPMMKQRWEAKTAAVPCGCTPIPNLPNGLQIFAGGIPLYRGNTLVGAIGISGDGIDQDDFIAAGGANNFAPPPERRSDRVVVRGARLPFIKIPARPTL